MQHPLAKRAKKAFPAGTLGNFDAGVFITRGKGSRVWDHDQ